MHPLRIVTVPFFLLFGVIACAPMPGQDALNSGVQHAARGSWVSSINASRQALEIAENKEIIFLAYSTMCDYQIWQGRHDAALENCNYSIKAKPGFSGNPYAARGRIFAILSRYDWAIEEFDIAIELGGSRLLATDDPGVIAVGGKARIYATSPDSETRNPQLAVKFAEKAIQLESKLASPAYIILNRDTLAAAYAAAGRFHEAIETQRSTIAMVVANAWQSIVINDQPMQEFLEAHLRTFQDSQPLSRDFY